MLATKLCERGGALVVSGVVDLAAAPDGTLDNEDELLAALRFGACSNAAMKICEFFSGVRPLVHASFLPSGEKTGSPSKPSV